MKYLKKTVIVFLMIISVVISSEIYQSYLNMIDNFVKTDFYIPSDCSRENMLSEINETANSNNIIVFKLHINTVSAFHNVIDIYADTNVLSYLEKNYFLKEGEFRSFVSGKTTVNVYDYSEIPETLINDEPFFNLIGNIEDMRNFKSELVYCIYDI